MVTVSDKNTRIFSSSAILIRRIDYGDHDTILTFITKERGKISAIAKNAKKSIKRFSGVLELFSSLDIVIRSGKPTFYLHEASLENPHENIRQDILKTAYASYWAETLVQWLEEDVRQERVYHLFEYALNRLDEGILSPEALSILFQLKFLSVSGFTPGLQACARCANTLENIRHTMISFDIETGNILCEKCRKESDDGVLISKGTAKQLTWVLEDDICNFPRVRFIGQAVAEGLKLLDRFLPFHLGKAPNSLKFLHKIRG